MNKQILDILIPKLESKWETVLVNIDNFEEIRLKLPTKPGIYQIRTTAPISVLSKLPVENKRIDAAHCNFREKIKKSKTLESLYIQEDVINGYVVYTGHQKSIRQRCKEHFKGSQGTGCLHFFEFEELREYDWWLIIWKYNILRDLKILIYSELIWNNCTAQILAGQFCVVSKIKKLWK